MNTADIDSALTLNHFTLTLDKQRIAWLSIDVADSLVNRLTSDVMRELSLVLDHLASQPPAGMVIYSGKDSGFIAGADIDEFSGLDNAGSGLALVARGW